MSVHCRVHTNLLATARLMVISVLIFFFFCGFKGQIPAIASSLPQKKDVDGSSDSWTSSHFFFCLFFWRLQLFVRTISIQSSNSEEFGITCMSLDRGRKPEYMERSLHRRRENVQTQHEKSPGLFVILKFLAPSSPRCETTALENFNTIMSAAPNVTNSCFQ